MEHSAMKINFGIIVSVQANLRLTLIMGLLKIKCQVSRGAEISRVSIMQVCIKSAVSMSALFVGSINERTLEKMKVY